jgi:3'-phosphoadenosine 5'-phosphosulfate sulfotransferase (PAPS reductase)/FAD synthetase
MDEVSRMLTELQDLGITAATDVPATIARAMELGAAIVVSVSGGKDSMAMLQHVTALHRLYKWKGEIYAIFAELGRIEWSGVLEHIRQVCDRLEIRLVVVQRQKGGMIDRWRERYQTLKAEGNTKPFWSSSAQRYCTSDLKRTPIDAYLRSHQLVVCATGIRAQESTNRAKQPVFKIRSNIAAKYLKTPADHKDARQQEAWADHALEQWLLSDRAGRLALDWHPIFDWDIERVWQTLGTSSTDLDRRRKLFRQGDYWKALENFSAHWAYVAGNSRLSCSQCVLASMGDLKTGALHNPFTWLELALLEQESEWSFKRDFWLTSLRSHIFTMSSDQRYQLLRALYGLGLVQRWADYFRLQLLQQVSMYAIAVWTNEFLEAALEELTE